MYQQETFYSDFGWLFAQGLSAFFLLAILMGAFS